MSDTPEQSRAREHLPWAALPVAMVFVAPSIVHACWGYGALGTAASYGVGWSYYVGLMGPLVMAGVLWPLSLILMDRVAPRWPRAIRWGVGLAVARALLVHDVWRLLQYGYQAPRIPQAIATALVAGVFGFGLGFLCGMGCLWRRGLVWKLPLLAVAFEAGMWQVYGLFTHFVFALSTTTKLGSIHLLSLFDFTPGAVWLPMSVPLAGVVGYHVCVGRGRAADGAKRSGRTRSPRERTKRRVWAVAAGAATMAAVIWAPGLVRQARLDGAIEDGNVDLAERLIDAGADVDKPEFLTRRTPLIYSAIWDEAESARLLLGKGADPDATDRPWGATALHYATNDGHADVVRALLEGGADPDIGNAEEFDQYTRGPGNTPLHLATREGHFECIRALLAGGAHVDARNLPGDTPLTTAISRGDLTSVGILLENGADPALSRVSGQLPLQTAMRRGNWKIAALLVAAGADPNEPTSGGETVLHVALRQKQHDLALRLLENGADVSGPDARGFTPPRHVIIYGDSPGVLEALADAGSDMHIKGPDGRTLLHYAAYYGRAECARVLIERGADVTARDDEGKTPLDIARADPRRKAVVEVLEGD